MATWPSGLRFNTEVLTYSVTPVTSRTEMSTGRSRQRRAMDFVKCAYEITVIAVNDDLETFKYWHEFTINHGADHFDDFPINIGDLELTLDNVFITNGEYEVSILAHGVYEIKFTLEEAVGKTYTGFDDVYDLVISSDGEDWTGGGGGGGGGGTWVQKYDDTFWRYIRFENEFDDPINLWAGTYWSLWGEDYFVTVPLRIASGGTWQESYRPQKVRFTFLGGFSRTIGGTIHKCSVIVYSTHYVGSGTPLPYEVIGQTINAETEGNVITSSDEYQVEVDLVFTDYDIFRICFTDDYTSAIASSGSKILNIEFFE